MVAKFEQDYVVVYNNWYKSTLHGIQDEDAWRLNKIGDINNTDVDKDSINGTFTPIKKFLDFNLFVATDEGNVDSVRGLLKEGENCNYENKTPRGSTKSMLYLAAENGSVGVAEELLNTENNDHIDEMVKWVNEDKWTPLHMAAHNGNTQMVELLISKGADCNAKEGGAIIRRWISP